MIRNRDIGRFLEIKKERNIFFARVMLKGALSPVSGWVAEHFFDLDAQERLRQEFDAKTNPPVTLEMLMCGSVLNEV